MPPLEAYGVPGIQGDPTPDAARFSISHALSLPLPCPSQEGHARGLRMIESGGEGERERENPRAAAKGPRPKPGTREIRKGGLFLTPDRTAVETHYSRSRKFRRLIYEFLLENEGTRWSSRRELYGRAGNRAGCGLEASERWVFQAGLVDAPWRFNEDPDGSFLIERARDWSDERVRRAIKRGDFL